MLKTMERGGRATTEHAVDAHGHWAIGRVHLGLLHPEPQLPAGTNPRTVFHGDLTNRTALASGLNSRQTSAAAVLGDLYVRHGVAAAGMLKGHFCAAILDEGAHRLILITDRFGSYPLYWFHAGDRFGFASEVRSLMPAMAARALNPLAVNDLFVFGFPTGDRTLAAGVALLPPSSTLVYDWQAKTVHLSQYATWAPAFRSSGLSKEKFHDTVTGAFEAAMARATEGRHRYALSLSGGLDTRVLLSALDRQHVPLYTSTLGGRGCADEVIGEQLAAMAGTDHHFVPLEEGFLADLKAVATQMMSLTDGMYTSHGFTEVLALRSFEPARFDVLLRGHLGELAKASTAYPFHTDAAIFGMSSKAAVLSHLLARQESLNHASRAAGLFAPAWADASNPGVPKAALEAAADADLSPADLCSYIYLTEYHRRVTIPSLDIFRNVGEVRLPLADDEFVGAVLGGDPKWRDGLEIHQTLIRRINPKFLKIRNPNTGAPAGAGPWQEFVLDKLNSVLRRLNVYGYRHYHAFDGWMRKALLDLAEQVLFEAQTLDRGILQRGPLKALVDGARGGDASADHVLQVLVLVELWQRESL